ncbi:ribonuclease E/G [Paremcibacter congregatus]|uniref:ribonuclease E/G n=1 Tax=Paremcibacter congregatus TaxID=2043170 RepID=UPI003A8CD460
MTLKMLIDATHEEETRVAIVDGNRVEEFDYESSAKKQIKGNIYLAKITRVEPSLQAAFVEYGGNRHGFLAFSEIHPDYYQIPVSDREALIAEETAAYESLLEKEEIEEEEIVEKKPKKRAPRRARKPARDKTDDTEVTPETPAEEATETAASSANTETPEGIVPAEAEAEAPEADHAEAPENDAAGSDEKPTTKAESVSDPDTITEDVTSDDHDSDDEPIMVTDTAPSNVKEVNGDDDHDEDDDTEIAGSQVLDDEEAEEKLRIKIAKGLRRKYKIQEVIKKNQIVLVQVVKEERGNKGAALTTYLSLPGRYCVLMPNTLHGGGVSRKIASASERKSLKKILSDLDMPTGIACIIRTAGHNRTKTEIKRDFDYLIRTWEGIRERTLKSVAPVLINEEGDLIKRSIRDLYTRDIEEILVEGEGGYKTARNFMKLLMPSHARKIKHYTDPIPLLHRYQVESQLDSMYSPIVQLKSGGYIVINPTEALVSIDVNSGKATKEHNIEETARKTNLEAAEEVARQLRLRDMAGLIVIDFIDMEVRGNNRAVEQKMKDCLKSDRARIQVGRISSFGLMEMSRQRLRAGVLESSTTACPHCEGAGVIRSVESQVLHILRALEEEGIKGRNKNATIYLPEKTAIYLLNNKKAKLVSLEEQYDFAIEVAIDSSLTEAGYRLELPVSDSKKNDRRPAAQPKKSSGRDHREPHQGRQDREQSANERRNRQRNENRKNRDRGPQGETDQEDNESPDTASDNRPENAAPENQENKPRRRRRRSRRGGNSEAQDTATETPENVAAEATLTPDSGSDNEPANEAKPADATAEEKPKRRRRTRSRRKPDSEGVTETDSADAGAKSSDEKTEPDSKVDTDTAEKKPVRRPYPPQARSRRKATEPAEKSAEKPSDKAPEKEPKKAVEKPVPAPAAKEAAPKPAPAKDVSDKPAEPKKSGWWQRTFG